MKTLVIYYSLTGNNEQLATRLAADLGAESVRITESKSRSMGKTVMDVILKRTPKVTVEAPEIAADDLVLFVGPVWMGQVATPLRACFEHLKGDIARYAFASISGGADGPNPNLQAELTRRLGKAPLGVIDLHIADLLPSEPKPERKDTSNYRVTASDVDHLSATALAQLKEMGGITAN